MEDGLQPVRELGGEGRVSSTPIRSSRTRSVHSGIVEARDIKAVIHSKPERKRALPLDRRLYRQRYLSSSSFHSLKRYRAIATRFEKTVRNYLALIHVACMNLWLA